MLEGVAKDRSRPCKLQCATWRSIHKQQQQLQQRHCSSNISSSHRLLWLRQCDCWSTALTFCVLRLTLCWHARCWQKRHALVAMSLVPLYTRSCQSLVHVHKQCRCSRHLSPLISKVCVMFFAAVVIACTKHTASLPPSLRPSSQTQIPFVDAWAASRRTAFPRAPHTCLQPMHTLPALAIC